MDVAVLVIVSCGARRVELAYACPPHWRGAPLFGSQCRLRPLYPPGLSLFHFSVTFLCFSSLFRFVLLFLPLFFSTSLFSLLSSLPYFPSLFCSVAPFSHLCLIFLHTVSRASLFILIFSPLLHTQPHTLSHVTPPLAFMPLFSVSFPCRIGTEFRTAKTF